MYLSNLLIDVGDNPDRPRPGRLWLRNVYHVHQRLSMAFPSAERAAADPQFLAPFNPNDFPAPRFLFRVDNTITDDRARAVIVVQSTQKPDWDYAFQNARIFLAAPPSEHKVEFNFVEGDVLRFRVRMNLSKKAKTSKSGVDLTSARPGVDSRGRPKAQSKRVSLTWDHDQNPELVIRDWFAGKGQANGFALNTFRLLHMGRVIGSKANRGAPPLDRPTNRMTFQSALLEGTLSVTDAGAFANTLTCGIGSAKAFGFGLLTVAPNQETVKG